LCILFISRQFTPAVGGLEIVGSLLVTAWVDAGHQVTIVTETPQRPSRVPLKNIINAPGTLELLRLARKADIVVQNGISLRALPPLVASNRRIVFIHHNLLGPRPGTNPTWERVKRLATRLGTNVAVSEAVARTIPGRARLIPNPYRPDFSTDGPAISRSGAVYVGRLVTDKGVDVAIDAIALLRDLGTPTRLIVIGDGPERGSLERRATALNLGDLVLFRGALDAADIRDAYLCAACAVMPSRYEPFGIAALEAIACGCPLVATNADGLPEAVGGCGILVHPNDVAGLAHGISLCQRNEEREMLIRPRREHLRKHHHRTVAQRYIDTFYEVARL